MTELLTSLVIVLIVGYVGFKYFISVRDNTELSATTKAVLFHLEEAKANAVAGRGGEDHGVHFTARSYALFEGSTYDAEDEGTVVYEVSGGMVVSTTFSDGAVVFARMSGEVDEEGTITIQSARSSSTEAHIVIGPRGDISLSE